MGFQISLFQFHKNSLSERLLEGKDVTLWDEFTEHRAVSQKISFQFSSEGIFFFTIGLYGLPNIPLQFPQEQSNRKAYWGESCNSVRWIHRSKRNFAESFFLILIGGYYHWPYSFHRDSKYQFSDSTEIRLANSSTKYNCKSVSGSHTSQSSFSESFFPVFIWGYFLFQHRPQWASKYPFANSTRTVLANGFWRGKL